MANPFETPTFNPFAQQSAQTKYPGNQNPMSGGEESKVPHAPDKGTTTDPNGSQSQGKSLIDQMSEAWDNKDDKPDNGIQTLSEEQINKVKEKYNVAIDEEALSAALQNQDASALKDIIAQAGKDSYAAAIAFNSAVSDNYIGQEREKVQSRMKTQLTQTRTMESLQSKNAKLFESTPMKDFANDLIKKFTSKYPDASPEDAANKIYAYMQETMGFNQTKDDSDKDDSAGKGSEVDWTKY